MAAQDSHSSILNDFVKESLILMDDCYELLESAEENPSEVEKLADFANRIDRVMGGARSLALGFDNDHALYLIGDYCAICKSVGYQGAKIQNNDQLYNVTVALLLDAIEMVKTFLGKLDVKASALKKTFPSAFLERLKWISFQFDEIDRKANASGQRLEQNEIDALLKKLGL